MHDTPIKVEKVWGYELWLANTELYCGKILHLEKDHFCSYHYHKIKDETFYVLKGLVRFYISSNYITVGPGLSIHISSREIHSFCGLETSDIIEISTHHSDDDSYRLTESGKL